MLERLPKELGAVNPKLGEFLLQSPFMLRTSHLRALLLLICRNAVSITGAEGGDLWLRAGRYIHRCVSLNLPEQVIGDIVLKVGRGPAGKAAAGGMPIVCEDLSSDTSVEYSQTVRQAGIHGYLAVPVVLGKDRIGVLAVVTTSRPRKFTADDIARLQLLSDTAALAIDHCLRRPEAIDCWRKTLDRLCDLFGHPQQVLANGRRGFPSNGQFRDVPKSLHPVTLTKVYDFLLDTTEPADCATIAAALGMSLATARRYANYLVEVDAAEMELKYGHVGRPKHGYTISQ